MGSFGKLRLPPPFEEAMAGLERDLMRFLLRTTRDREDSLDLFQETWLRAYRSYPKLRAADGLRPWVFSIAANLCRNRARDRVRRERVFVSEGGEPAASTNRIAQAAPGSPDGVLNLKAAISRLPGKQGRALAMRKLAGLDYAEIGAALNCSPQSARASVYQALKKLKAAR